MPCCVPDGALNVCVLSFAPAPSRQCLSPAAANCALHSDTPISFTVPAALQRIAQPRNESHPAKAAIATDTANPNGSELTSLAAPLLAGKWLQHIFQRYRRQQEKPRSSRSARASAPRALSRLSQASPSLHDLAAQEKQVQAAQQQAQAGQQGRMCHKRAASPTAALPTSPRFDAFRDLPAIHPGESCVRSRLMVSHLVSCSCSCTAQCFALHFTSFLESRI